MSSGLSGQRRPRSICASSKSDQGLCCPLQESLESIEYIDEEQMPGRDGAFNIVLYFQDFTVTALLHLNWVDGRFSAFLPQTNEGYVEIDSKNLEKLWVPDLFFPNEKNAYYHDVLMPNKMLRIFEGGTLSYTTRYVSKMSLGIRNVTKVKCLQQPSREVWSWLELYISFVRSKLAVIKGVLLWKG